MEKKIIDGEIYPIKKWLTLPAVICGALTLTLILSRNDYWIYRICATVAGSLLAILLLCILIFWDFQIIVTDKRVLGITTFNRKVDLPLDSVSAIGTSAFKGISVATSSGKISFLFIKNAEDIRHELNKLIIQRQEERENTVPEQTTINQVSNADELRK